LGFGTMVKRRTLQLRNLGRPNIMAYVFGQKCRLKPNIYQKLRASQSDPYLIPLRIK
jgi:hypothetical protein